MEQRKWIVVWPLYFDKRRSRSEGRRVPLSLSIEKPTLHDLIKAIEKLGLKYVVEEDKRHPSTWFESSGRILVEKRYPKTKLLKLIAKTVLTIKRR